MLEELKDTKDLMLSGQCDNIPGTRTLPAAMVAFENLRIACARSMSSG